MRRAAAALLLALGLHGVARAEEPALRMLIDSATELPMADIGGDQVRGGLTAELGELIAAELGRPLQFVLRPRKRVTETLAAGEADFVCTYRPEWLPGPWHWSPPFLPQADLLVTRRDAAPPARLEDVRGQSVGTVLGFAYPELERRLGAALRRDDAPNAQANLRKLQAGRINHAVVESRLLAHHLRHAQPPLRIHSPLLVSEQLTQCALSPRAPLAPARLDAAIQALQHKGLLRALLARYELPSTRSSSRP